MEFGTNESQAMIADTVKKFAEAHIRPNIMEWDEAQIFPVELFKKNGRTGPYGHSSPGKI